MACCPPVSPGERPGPFRGNSWVHPEFHSTHSLFWKPQRHQSHFSLRRRHAHRPWAGKEQTPSFHTSLLCLILQCFGRGSSGVMCFRFPNRLLSIWQAYLFNDKYCAENKNEWVMAFFLLKKLQNPSFLPCSPLLHSPVKMAAFLKLKGHFIYKNHWKS